MATQISFQEVKKVVSRWVEGIKKIPWIFGNNAFLWIILLMMVDILCGEYLFYQYVILARVQEPNIPISSTKFQENTYQSVLGEWQTRDQIFNAAPEKNYQDPFQ